MKVGWILEIKKEARKEDRSGRTVAESGGFQVNICMAWLRAPRLTLPNPN